MNDNRTPEEQPEENPNIGKQFEEMMGKNFTPEEEQKMEIDSKYNHLFGDESDAQNEISSETTALSRFHDFPSHMIHYDDMYGYHVKLTTPRGWTHIWSGGPYIEHQSRPGNTDDVTNMEDYSKPHDEQPYYHGISMATFLDRINNFEKDAEDNFPDDRKPPQR